MERSSPFDRQYSGMNDERFETELVALGAMALKTA
jgi:hypothetical protein